MSFTFSQPTSAASSGTAGAALGTFGSSAATAAPGGGFTFATPAAVLTTATAPAGVTGFAFGAQPSAVDNQQAKSVRFDVAGIPAAAPAASAPQSVASTLSSLLSGGITSSTLPATTTSVAPLGVGFQLGNFATPAAAASMATTSAVTGLKPSLGLSFGLGQNTLASTSAAVAPGVFGTAASTAAPIGIFGVIPASSTLATTTATLGLGGVTGIACGSTAGPTKTCDAKAIKEMAVPAEILTTVDDFTKHVKTQKVVRENIARMSSKPLYRVQEDLCNLRQQLLLVTGGLQRNAVAIDKLKKDTSQELKHAEIAQRTKDTPPGLQYENTAPSDYFYRLANEFEVQMQLYRQQIVEMEKHLESADHVATLTPQELSLLLSKLNEGFIALAAQLQVVHEAVKEQKESYATYRRTVFGDSVGIFDRRYKPDVCYTTSGNTLLATAIPVTVGPTPFGSMSNSAAVAMAAAMNRNQPTSAAAFSGGTASLAMPSTLGSSSLFGQTATGTGTTFGTATTTVPSAFGCNQPSSLFGAGNQPTGGLFGQSPATAGGGLFGNAPTGPSFGLATPQPFALSKTPIGSKRGKNV